MNDWSEKTIVTMAKRSDVFVLGITAFFAITGAMLAMLFSGQNIWGIWIPMCFTTIPPIHYLCREVIRMRRKIEELERRLR